jgi:FKBP-type peptidyl-prolyl cis-trans isomerase
VKLKRNCKQKGFKGGFMAKEKIKSGAKRAGWLFLVILFLVTSLGVGVAAFWQATHQDNSTSQTTPPPSSATGCGTTSENSTESNLETLPVPDVYKAPSKVDQLQTTDLQSGTGQEAKAGDCLVMKYYGTLASDGQKFDENFTKNTGFKFKLGAQQVIAGWDQGLVGMKVGGIRRLVLPSNLGYGATGSPPTIPANSDLVFVVKLESIK